MREKDENLLRKSERLLENVRLRVQETDRLLDGMGTSRAEVAAMRFTPIQLAMVGEELRRRGFVKLGGVI